MIESLPRRGRWPRLRLRPDEARLYRYYPCTGYGGKVSLISPLRGQLPPMGKPKATPHNSRLMA